MKLNVRVSSPVNLHTSKTLTLVLHWLMDGSSDHTEGGLTLFCILCACLRLAWRLCTTWLSPCFSLCPSPSRSLCFCYLPSTLYSLVPAPSSIFCCYNLQVYFTTWSPQGPPISLGQHCQLREASVLSSVSPPPPPPLLLPPKLSSTPPPSQPPHAWLPCPLLSHSPRLSTAAPRRSCTAPLLQLSPCPLLPLCTVLPPPQQPHILTPHHPPDQTPSIPLVSLISLTISRGRSHLSHSPTPPLPPPLLLCALLLPLPPLCQPPPLLVRLQCTTLLVCPLLHPLPAQVAVGACGGLLACMPPTSPPSSPVPDLDRVCLRGWRMVWERVCTRAIRRWTEGGREIERVW